MTHWDKLNAAIGRIVGSQKVIMAAVAGLFNLVGVSLSGPLGYDPTKGSALWAMAIVNILFGVLIIGQLVLDIVRGSPSDGTGEFAQPPVVPIQRPMIVARDVGPDPAKEPVAHTQPAAQIDVVSRSGTGSATPPSSFMDDLVKPARE